MTKTLTNEIFSEEGILISREIIEITFDEQGNFVSSREVSKETFNV